MAIAQAPKGSFFSTDEPAVRPILDLFRKLDPGQGELPLTGGQWQEGAVQNDPLRPGKPRKIKVLYADRDKRKPKTLTEL
jgi:hypothetical protein